MVGAGWQEALEELEVRAGWQEAPEEPEVGGAQMEALERSSSDEGEDGGGQPQVRSILILFG
jgi:hypothetical protein